MAEDLGHQVAFSTRVRNVSIRYPHQLALAYSGDTEQALADDPETVAATVAAWEREEGWEPRDWSALGRTEESHSGVDPGPPRTAVSRPGEQFSTSLPTPSLRAGWHSRHPTIWFGSAGTT